MGNKDFLISLGERTENPTNTDELLRSKVSERQRREIERQEERDEAKHQAEMAKYKKDEAAASAAAEKTGEKKEESGGFKIHGGINLGEIDYQQMLKEQMEERDKLRQEAEQAAAQQHQLSEELREKLHTAEMEVLKTSFSAQMQILTKMIEQNSSKGSFTEQLAAAQETAKQLGFAHVTPNGGDAMVQIELKKLDFEHEKAMKEMIRADKAEQRKWDLELRRLDDEREERKARLENEAKRLEFFKSTPKAFGEAIGQALLTGGAAGAGATEMSNHPKAATQYRMDVPQGAGGEADCPECGSKIGVGPTARQAICTKCQTKITINRTKAAEGEGGPPPSGEEEEEETTKRW